MKHGIIPCNDFLQGNVLAAIDRVRYKILTKQIFMGLLDFFRQPKWKNGNSSVRLAAVDEMDSRNLETLLEIIREDSDLQVRQAALAKIDDQQTLESLLQKKLPDDLLKQATKQLEQKYTEQILASSDQSLANQLIQRISNQELLAEIAARAESVALRVLAVEAIDDQNLLSELLKKPCGKKPALAAVKKISDSLLLAEISQKAANKAARRQAAIQLEAVGQKKNIQEPAQTKGTAPDSGENREATKPAHIEERIRLGRNLCLQIENLCSNMDEKAGISFAGIIKQWPDFTKAGQDNDVLLLEKKYQELCIQFSSVRKEYLNEKAEFADFTLTCQQIEKLLEKDNLSGAEKLLDDTITRLEQTNWHWFNSADIAQCFLNYRQKLEQRKDELTVIAKTENQHIQAMKEACEQMEQFASATERYQLGKKANTVITAWDTIPETAKQAHPELITRFQTALDDFEEKQQQFYEEQQWQLWSNKTKKEELCDKVAELEEETDLHIVSKKLKKYQADWKTIGPVPKKDADELWQKFKTLCDKAYDRCRKFYTELDRKRQECTALKEDLCSQAESHMESENWKKSADFLKDLQKQWKEAGPAERDREQELYARFRAACDHFFNRRSVFFAEQDLLRQENLKAKEALCFEVEELVKNPKIEHGRKIQEIQKRWKAIGPVPRKHDEEIWRRFRGLCDTYYSWLDEQRQKNLQQKTALCEQVEALLPETEEETIDREVIDKVIELQKQWKTIGPVPRDQADELWQRFKGKCDIFFVERKIRQQEEDKKRFANQEAKEELLRLAGEAMALPNQSEITARLQELQQQWKHIGPAPREHDQLLWDEFHGLCNAFFQEKRERYLEKTAVLEDNLKKKEELCFQLERLAGKSPEEEQISKGSGLDIAEQFKIAREANFLLAGKTKNVQAKREEVRRIQQEWKAVGTTFRDKEQKLWKRYRTAIDLIYSENPHQGKEKKTQPAQTETKQ